MTAFGKAVVEIGLSTIALVFVAPLLLGCLQPVAYKIK